MSPTERLTNQSSLHSLEKPTRPAISFGSYLPKQILTDQEIQSWGITLKDTGIEKRYVANEEETPLFMGVSASKHTLGITEKPIDAVLVSTSFPQGINLSQKISEQLKLSPQLNMDIHAACSGFGRTFSFLKEQEEKYNLNGKRILIVATEKYSPYFHDLKTEGEKADPSLAQTLFSDGAYTMIFEYGRNLQILSTFNFRFPQEFDSYIQMPVERKLMIDPFIEEYVPESLSGKFEQNGRGVLGTISRNFWPLITEAVQNAGLTSLDIKKIFPHQGSGPMITAIIDKKPKNYPDGIVYEDYFEGNFSSGSIPKALQKALRNDEIKKGDNIVLAGFGAGIFASIAVVKLG